MANPSLQIGNSNWAIKKDNLLGYSTAGTRFLPIPITMTRASAGTRVNPQGLVETVELLGSEEITGFTNGTSYPYDTFTTSTNNITSAIVSSAWAGAASNAISLVSGKVYKVTFDYTKNSGNDLRVKFSSQFSGAGTGMSNTFLISASGSQTLELIPTSTETGYLQLGTASGSDSLDISITNVSVKESTKNNLARVDYTGSTSSLLAEPQRTNLITYSEDFSNAAWSISELSFGSKVTSPTGTNDAITIIETDATAQHNIFDAVVFTNEPYTLSCYAKLGTSSNRGIFLRVRDGNTSGTSYGIAFFNLSNATFTTSGGISANIENVGNGWYRCSLTVTAPNSSSFCLIGLADGNSNYYDGDGTSNVFIWGAQVEQGSYATSIIPTNGSTVTRVKDQYSKTGISDLIGQTEGTMFIEFIADEDIPQNMNIINFNNSTQASVIINKRTGGEINAKVYAVGSAVVDINSAVVSGTTKAAFAYKSGDNVLYVNGVPTSDSNTFTFNGVLSEVRLAAQEAYFNYGHKCNTSQVQIYKTRLSNSELATLTTI